MCLVIMFMVLVNNSEFCNEIDINENQHLYFYAFSISLLGSLCRTCRPHKTIKTTS